MRAHLGLGALDDSLGLSVYLICHNIFKNLKFKYFIGNNIKIIQRLIL